MSVLPPNIIFTNAQPSDIPAIHEIFRLCFLPDTHTQLKNLVKGEDGSLDEGSAAYYKSLIDHPRIDYIVAKDTTSGSGDDGTVVGYAAWGKRNFDIADDKVSMQPTTWGPTPPQPALPSHTPLTVADLEATTNKSMSDWQDYLCHENVRCRFIVGLSVHPECQGKGIGKALMRWGTDKCDEDGVYAWVQGSMSSQKAYESVGFKEVGRLELDLDIFSEGTPPPAGSKDGKWGTYIWPYMRRDPVFKGQEARRA